MTDWQRLHFRFEMPAPLLEPLAVERPYLDNFFFSITQTTRDLAYRSRFTAEHAVADCLSYYVGMCEQMKSRMPARRSLDARTPPRPATGV